MAQALDAKVLGQILLVESLVAQMPNQASMFQFAARGLEETPGIGRVWFQDTVPAREAGTLRAFEIHHDGGLHAALCFDVVDEADFSPYEPWLQNLAFMLGLVLDERVHRERNEQYRRELETLVGARTQALVASESRARSMLRGALDGVWLVDGGGRLLEVNEAACAMLGYGRDELLAMRAEEIGVQESTEAIRAHLARIQGKGFDLYVARHRRKDGTEIEVEVSVTVLKELDQTVVFVRDVTERKKKDDELERSRDLLSRSSDCLYIVDPASRRFTEMNETTCQVLGYRRDVLVAMRIEVVDPGFRIERWGDHVERAKHAKEGLMLESWHQCKDGSLIPVEIRARHVVVGGAEYIVASARNIAERKRAEQENARLEVQLQQAQKMESLGTLSGGLAHDMNNVLGAILGLASANMEVQPKGSPAGRAFETIARAATRGGEMVKRLLAFARQGNAQESVLEVNDLVQEQVCLLERTTLAKVSLELDLEPGLHPVRGDAGALGHALMNLCVNAVDAMPEKGRLTLRTRNLDPDWITLEVEDTGLGMPKEVLDRAMDPFFTTKGVGKGTGLGLSLVYSTVKAHGGQIELLSKPGQGTLARMRFPACGLQSGPPEPVAGPEPGGSERALRALLVDDDELVRSAVETMLQSLGHAVVSSPSGEAALAEVESGCRPDLVILDVNMPGLGGGAALSRIRALLPSVPILLSTGRVDQAVLALANRDPLVTLLPKPYTFQELQSCLERLGRP